MAKPPLSDPFGYLSPPKPKMNLMGTCAGCHRSVRLCEIVEYNGKCEDCAVCPGVKRQDLPSGLTKGEEETLREYFRAEVERRKLLRGRNDKNKTGGILVVKTPKGKKYFRGRGQG